MSTVSVTTFTPTALQWSTTSFAPISLSNMKLDVQSKFSSEIVRRNSSDASPEGEATARTMIFVSSTIFAITRQCSECLVQSSVLAIGRMSASLIESRFLPLAPLRTGRGEQDQKMWVKTGLDCLAT